MTVQLFQIMEPEIIGAPNKTYKFQVKGNLGVNWKTTFADEQSNHYLTTAIMIFEIDREPPGWRINGPSYVYESDFGGPATIQFECFSESFSNAESPLGDLLVTFKFDVQLTSTSIGEFKTINISPGDFQSTPAFTEALFDRVKACRIRIDLTTADGEKRSKED